MVTRRGWALVTGAVGGLGTATVERLLGEGYSVVACDRRQDLVAGWLDRFPAGSRERLSYHHVDVTREDEIEGLAAKLRTEKIEIAYLVNNAGVQGAADVWDVQTKLWERVRSVNLDATFYFTRAFSRPMVEHGFGRIVNFASVYAYHPGKGQSPYAAAKAGIIGFTHATALELAEHGITVNVISPGLIMHEGLRGLFTESWFAEMTNRIPAKRAGRPEEIAATIAFLLSDEASYITGQTIHVNGGLYLPG